MNDISSITDDALSFDNLPLLELLDSRPVGSNFLGHASDFRQGTDYGSDDW